MRKKYPMPHYFFVNVFPQIRVQFPASPHFAPTIYRGFAWETTLN